MLGLILFLQEVAPPAGTAGLEARREQLVGARAAPASFGGAEQAPVELSVRDAVLSALQNNLDLEIARYAPLKAEQEIDIAWGAFDWIVHADPAFHADRSPAASLLTSRREAIWRGDVGVRQITPLGISYDLVTTAQRTSTNNIFSTLNPNWRQSLGITVRIPTLRGLGLDAQYATVIIAQRNRGLADQEFALALHTTIFAVEKSYWDLVVAREVLRAKQEAFEVTAKLLEANRQRLAAGIVARTDVTRAEADLAAAEDEIIVARNAVGDATDVLWNLVDPAKTRQPARMVPIVPTERPPEPGPPVDEPLALESGLVEALRSRPELAKIQTQKMVQDLILQSKEDAALPKLDIIGSAAYRGLARRFDGGLYDSTFNTETHDWGLGLSLELPLGNFQAAGERIKAELERRRLELERRKLEDTILLELRRAVREIKSTEQRIETARKRVATARENYQAEEDRLAVGASSSFEVLSALQLYTEAQINELRSRVDRHMADLELDKAAGTLLGKRGIVLEEQAVLKGAY